MITLADFCNNYIEECNYYSGGNEQIYDYCCNYILNIHTEKQKTVLLKHFKID